MTDEIIVSDSDVSINVLDKSENIIFSVSDEEQVITEKLDGVEITVLDDVISLSDNDDSVTLTDTTDMISPVFTEGISQTINNDIVYNISEDDMPYLEEIDFVDDDIIYRGWAIGDVSMSEPLWRIQKIEFINTDGDVRKRYANNDPEFVFVWNNRATYNYPV